MACKKKTSKKRCGGSVSSKDKMRQGGGISIKKQTTKSKEKK